MSALTARLDEWAALADKATPGPWWQSAPGLIYGKDRFQEGYAEAVGQATPGNGDFIAASRGAVPVLVDALRAVLSEHEPSKVYLLADECGHDDDGHYVIESAFGDDLCGDSPTGEHYCPECTHEGDDELTSWPCATVRAVAAALGVEP